MAEELLLAWLAKTVPFAARAICLYFLWQVRKDPANAMKQVKGHTESDIEILKRPEVKQHFQDMMLQPVGADRAPGAVPRTLAPAR